MGLTIYNASAGSGKTYTLAAAYISKLLTEEGGNLHRHILAVTFTNKATAEMKSRIMQWLWALSQEDRVDTDFVLKMCEITPAMIEIYGLREVDIKERIVPPTAHKKIAHKASKVLAELVHDYNNFSVTTIDSFFQRVLADVAYELRLPSSYKLNLDTDSVMEEAVEELLTTLENEPKAYNWLKRIMAQKMEQNQSLDVRNSLQSYGKSIFDERYMMFSQDVKDLMADEALIEEYRNEMEATIAKSDKQLTNVAEQVEQAFEAEGLSIDFNGNLKSNIEAFKKSDKSNLWRDKTESNILYSKIANKLDEENTISLPKNGLDKRKETTAGVDVLNYLRSKFPEWKESYWSASLARTNLYLMRMMSILDRIVGEVNDKHNQFMLAKVGPFLQQLSQATGEESSFVFQKTGTRYRHIMIDEFQDTSQLQWRNFQLLFVEVLANSNTALIVGDSKQSIYRFRNGDWRIMQGLSELSNVALENLDTNYRSEPVVVTFNNTFFKDVVSLLEEQIGDEDKALTKLYETVRQNVRPDKPLNGGRVELYVLNKKVDAGETADAETDSNTTLKDYDKKVLSAMEQSILSLCDKGVKLNQMAILVRKNSEASKIIDYFSTKSDNTLRFVSSEAFKLNASLVVNIILYALRYACDRKDKVALAFLVQHRTRDAENNYLTALNTKKLHEALPEAYKILLPRIEKMPLYEVIEQVMVAFDIQAYLSQKDESERAYLYAFLDEVMRFLEVRAENVRGFLKHWDKVGEKKTIPMETTDAIQILTLHKSKGLEFHTVLMPYTDWALTENKSDNFYWMNTEEIDSAYEVDVEPYKRIPWLPISQSKHLADSIYAKQYKREQLMQYVDNVNLLYVAFTRAKANLLVWSGVEYASNYNGTITTVGHLLHEWIATAHGVKRDYKEPEIELKRDTEYSEEGKERVPISTGKKSQPIDNRLEIEGKSVQLHSSVEHFTQNHLSFLQSSEANRWIRNVADTADEQTKKTKVSTLIDTGILVHEVLASIRTLRDMPEALARLETNNGIKISNKAQREKVQQIITSCLADPQAKQWFDDTWQLYNECSLLEQTEEGNKIVRPDRVMVSADGNHIVVVDFKTGQPQKKYHDQVRHYMQLMQRMHEQRRTALQTQGHDVPQALVEGYLWYIGEDYRDIEKVTL